MAASVRSRLVLLGALTALVPLATLVFLWSQDLRIRARAEREREQARLAATVGDRVGGMVEDIQQLLTATARIPLVRTGGRAEVEGLLARLEVGRFAGGQLLVARVDGIVVGAWGPPGAAVPATVAAASGFRRAVETGRFVAGDPEPEGPLGPGLVAFWQPVRNEADVIVRLVGMALDGQAFAAAWEGQALAAGGPVLLLGRNGRVVAQGPPQDGAVGRDVSAAPLWAEVQRRDAATGEGMLTDDGVAREYAFRRLALPSWIVVVGGPPVGAAAGGWPPFTWTTGGALVLLVAGLGAVVWGFAENMTRALREVAAASRRLAAGDVRSPIRARGPGEIGSVAADLERVRQRLTGPVGGGPPPPPPAEDETQARTADPARRTQELALFHAVAAAGSRPEDRKAILDQMLAELVGYLDMDAAALYVQEADGRGLRLVAQAGHDPSSREAMERLPLGQGFAGRVAEGGELIVLEDVASDPGGAGDSLRLEGFRGLASVPLGEGGRGLGALEVVSRSSRKLGGHDLALLQAVARQLGVALAAAAATEEAGRRANSLQRLARLSRAITASLSPQEVVDLTVLAAPRLLDLAYVQVWLWDEETGRLRPGPWQGRGDLAAEGEIPGEPGPGAEAAGLGVEAREAVFIQDVAGDAHCPQPEWWIGRGASSLAALPLLVGERLLGALVAVPPGPSSFPEEERELLTLFAGQAAVAMENARLYQEMAGAETRPLAKPAAAPAAEVAPGAVHPFEARLGRVVAALSRAPGLARAAEALAAQAQEALGVGAARVAAVDARGVLRVGLGGEELSLRVPLHEPASLVARAVRERITQVWEGVGPCWEAGEGLVRGAAAAVPLVGGPGEEGGPPARSPAGALLLADPPADQGFGPELLVRAEELARVAAPALRRIQELEGARAVQARLEGLHRLDAALAAAADVTSALSVLPDEVGRIVDAGAAAVFHVDTAAPGSLGRVLRLAAGARVLDPGAGLDGEAGLVAAALASRAPLAAVGPFGEGAAGSLEAAAQGAGFQSVAVAPILAGGAAVALLVVCRREPEPFEAAALAALAMVAGRAGSAWEHRAWLADLRGQVSRFSVVADLARSVGSTLEVTRLVDVVLMRVRLLLPCDAASVAFDEPATGEVRFVRDLLAPEGPGAPFAVPAGETSVPLAMARQEPAVVPDLRDSTLALHRRWAEAGLRSLVEVPLVVEGRSRGALVVASRAPGGFSRDQVDLLATLAAYAAPAFANAQRVADLEQSTRDFKVAQEHLVRTEDLRAVGQMATALAQEFGDRLAVILARAQLALRRVEDPDLREGLEVIERAAAEGADSMRRLARVTRVRRAAGGPVLVDLCEVARQACEMTRARWGDEVRARGLAIQMVTDLEPVPPVPGDPMALREVLITAILNATNALPAGGRITVRVRAGDRDGRSGSVVSVADTGVGMPEELRARVLEPAVRGSGAGLGLASARAVVERHGGQLGLESAPGRGTTVSFWVPAEEAAPRGPAAPAPAAALPGAGLLVVHAEDDLARVLVEMAELEGYRVRLARTAAEARAAWEAGEVFDLVVAEGAVGEAGGSAGGVELARWVRARHPRVGFVLLTGWNETVDPDALRADGVDLVVEKPFRLVELSARLAEALGMARARGENAEGGGRSRA